MDWSRNRPFCSSCQSPPCCHRNAWPRFATPSAHDLRASRQQARTPRPRPDRRGAVRAICRPWRRERAAPAGNTPQGLCVTGCLRRGSRRMPHAYQPRPNPRTSFRGTVMPHLPDMPGLAAHRVFLSPTTPRRPHRGPVAIAPTETHGPHNTGYCCCFCPDVFWDAKVRIFLGHLRPPARSPRLRP